ncbi:follicle cell protein 3C-1-like [Ctenocephalides felis]|uniref:follicle cell protein 3C-1-like n=1 Tax=Ctenocephalides felis TaxID=7515 RepID=UPI000E6E3808|nr:follicle cell protein 3C-1-like [Ctenocephalides felis]
MKFQFCLIVLIALCAVAYSRPDVQTNVITAKGKNVDQAKSKAKAQASKAIESNKTKLNKEVTEIKDLGNEEKAKDEPKALAIPEEDESKPEVSLGCNCGIFMSGQIPRGSKAQPKGNPVLLQEQDGIFACTPLGTKQCTNKCLDTIIRHLPNSPNILCGLMDRDCHKERAYLFVRNCGSGWTNTKLSAGREYCCKEGKPYTCPLI